jgi:hypothetical protein
MVIRILVSVFILMSASVWGQELSLSKKMIEAYRIKNCDEIVRLYQENKNHAEMVNDQKIGEMASYCLSQVKMYREAVEIKINLIKKHYFEKHQLISKAIKNGESLDADSFPEELKLLYWKIFQNYSHLIKDVKKDFPELRKDFTHFSRFKNILGLLEFREGKVDKEGDEVVAHLKSLEDKVYKITKRVFVDYISWQRQVTLNMPSGQSALIITNKGVCSGGEIGYENSLYHFFADACVLYGSGGVGSVNSNPNYQQSNVPAYGIKSSIGAGLFVSSNKTEIGFKIPMLYSVQSLTNPPQDKFPGYKVNEGTPYSLIASLYSRWPFGAWFFQTEFGKYIDQDSVLWSLGGGYKF